ncbi:phosphotransferase [Methylosoma difficile]
MKARILSRRPSDLNRAWAQRIVNRHHANTEVSHVKVLSVDTGTTTRVKLRISHNGPDSLPSRWFVKLPSLSWRARLITALPRLLTTEVRFYQEVTPDIPLAIPFCLAAESQIGRSSTLVLADVTEIQAQAGHPGDALTVEQAALVIEELAALHSKFWGKQRLQQHLYWLDGSIRRLEDQLGTALAVPLMQSGLRRAGPLVSEPLQQAALSYAKNRRQVMAYLNTETQTLVHHDCHPGNLYWQNGKPGFLDWQMVRTGEGVSDVAYFLATSLSPENRRTHEFDLLDLYAQSLGKQGIGAATEKILRQRYRAHLAYAFEAMVVTLAVGGMMDLDSNRELIRRTAAAVEENNAFAELPCA